MIDGAVYNSADECLLPNIRRTSNAWDRMRGLLGSKPLKPGEGLLIAPCASVHMFFMSYAIDLAFIGRDNVIRKLVRNLRPWRMAACPGASMTLELAAGQIDASGLRVGMPIEWRALPA